MAEDRQKEWQGLIRAALERLDRPERIEPLPAANVQPAIRLWRYPAFASWTSWLLFTPSPNRGPKGSPVLRTVEWAQQEDASRLFSPMEGLKLGFDFRPSVSIKHSTLPLEEVTFLLEQLRSIKVAVFTKPRIGLDGTSFGLETVDPFCSARVEWWEEGPPALASLKAWYDDAVLLFGKANGDQ
jgi:hypothetical protein